jgi:crossover junction endodeoxyribonuclease RusA
MIGRASVQAVIIDLPKPISANAIWRNVVVGGKPRTLRSREYLAWVDEAGLRLNTQRPGMVSGHYALTITVTRKSRIDLDNTVKAVNDLLQSQGIVTNDRLCEQLLVKRGDVEGMRVMVCSTRGADEG